MERKGQKLRGQPNLDLSFEPVDLEVKKPTLDLIRKSKYGELYTLEPGADLEGADLEYIKFPEVDLEGANLRKADCMATDFREANFEGARVTGTDFERAQLYKAKFPKANVAHASFEMADLRYAEIDETINLAWAMYGRTTIDPDNYLIMEKAFAERGLTLDMDTQDLFKIISSRNPNIVRAREEE